MSALVISGGVDLSGEITVSGSKNAALPIIFATLITNGVSRLFGVPYILDVRIALDIIRELGAVVEWDGDTLLIDTTHLSYRTPTVSNVARIRASSYLLGALSARFCRAQVMPFGGCNFENRPIDMHLSALSALGATVSGSEISAPHLVGADIRFDKISVGATVNAILMSATAKGTTRIYGYAKEPHVLALIDYLISCGASISLSPDCITVIGCELHGGTARIIPDMIEAGTYLMISAMTGSGISVSGMDLSELEAFLPGICASGIGFCEKGGSVFPFGEINSSFDIVTGPHPAFPTDMQPQCAPLMSVAGGSIKDTVWCGRFGYLEELAKFGLRYTRVKNSAQIFPAKLSAAQVFATDLRGGAASLIAALACPGESVIKNAEIIDRGYEDIVNKLCSLGAKIKRKEI